MIKKLLLGIAIALALLIATVVWCYKDVLIKAPLTEKVVALTYDDGPNPPHTQALLQVLGEQGVHATFFMKGINVDAFPDAVAEVAAAGHEIGNHSYYHQAMLAFGSRQYRQEITRTNRALENVLGYQPVLFRVPYGAQGIGLTLALEELNMRSIGMGAIGSDWEVFDPRLIADAILDSIEPGAIILLHDGHGDVADPATQDSREASVAATTLLIETLQEQGYRFVTVGEMLELMAHSDQAGAH
jgi:peptidoglycan/xylan/chitin deacetylase (PgdA/CDA1 family)